MGNLAWVERAIKWLLWPQKIHGKRGNLHILLSSQCCLDMNRDGEGSPAPVTHEGFQVQVHGDVFGRCDGDADGAGKVVNAGVHHVAFTCKNALRKNQHRSDDGVCREERRQQSQEPPPDDTGANDQQPCVSNALPLEVEMHNSAWAACVSPPRLTERAVWSLVLAGITPRCPSASFSGLLSSACKTQAPSLPTQSRNSELVSVLNNTAIWLQKTGPLSSYIHLSL